MVGTESMVVHSLTARYNGVWYDDKKKTFESLNLEKKVNQALDSRPIIFEVEHII